METTVFVVSNCWWRHGADVLGVAAAIEGAHEIADRANRTDQSPEVTGWGEWKAYDQRPNTAPKWMRSALCAEGTHPSLYQEIVRMPVAVAARCPGCEHEWRIHGQDGCWFTVAEAGVDKSLGCPCSNSRPDVPWANPHHDVAGDFRRHVEQVGRDYSGL